MVAAVEVVREADEEVWIRATGRALLGMQAQEPTIHLVVCPISGQVPMAQVLNRLEF